VLLPPGTACLALYAQDSQWYPAIILRATTTPGRYVVRYTQYGTDDELPSTALKVVTDAKALGR